MVIDLEEEWDNFNRSLNVDEQVPELKNPQQKIPLEITVEETTNTQEIEHILVICTSEIVLRNE